MKAKVKESPPAPAKTMVVKSNIMLFHLGSWLVSLKDLSVMLLVHTFYGTINENDGFS